MRHETRSTRARIDVTREREGWRGQVTPQGGAETHRGRARESSQAGTGGADANASAGGGRMEKRRRQRGGKKQKGRTHDSKKLDSKLGKSKTPLEQNGMRRSLEYEY